MRGSKYTRAVLLPVVASSASLTEVLRKLGLRPVAGNYRHIRARIRSAELDTSHFAHGKRSERCRALTAEELAPLVRRSFTVAQVLVHLGLPPDGRAHRLVAARIRELALDTHHFRGQGWNRGETRATHPSVERSSRAHQTPDADIFIANSAYSNSRGLIRRLRALGRSYTCQLCGIATWRGAPLVLQLDHINGIHNDHRLANLRFLCPNCHSQTDTYCTRRRGTC